MDPDKMTLLNELFEGPLAALGVELVDIEYRPEANGLMLRVYIDREGGVNLETCAEASRCLKNIAGRPENGIRYDHMEVSSPGLNRVIRKDKDLLRFAGCRVKIKTFKKYPGPRRITGILRDFSAQEITVEDQQQSLLGIPRDMISIIRLDPDL